MIRFACPSCGKPLCAPGERAGAQTACPHCRQPVRVPTQDVASLPTSKTVLGVPVAQPFNPPPRLAVGFLATDRATPKAASEPPQKVIPLWRQAFLPGVAFLVALAITALIIAALALTGPEEGQKGKDRLVARNARAEAPSETALDHGRTATPAATAPERPTSDPERSEKRPSAVGRQAERSEDSATSSEPPGLRRTHAPDPKPPTPQERAGDPEPREPGQRPPSPPRQDPPVPEESAAPAARAPATRTEPDRGEPPGAGNRERPSRDGKDGKKDSDLPDVSLQIPEETRPEVKAIIRANVIGLLSARASDRMQAANVLGELKEEGKPVRNLLCRAMLDPSPQVRVAAADALKNIDPRMQYLAVALVAEENSSSRIRLMAQIQKLEEDGEPLAPLIIHVAFTGATNRENSTLTAAINALSHIAKNDLATCKLVASGLNNASAGVRKTALHALARMKHGRLAMSKILLLIKTDDTENRIAAIEAAVALADESTEEIATATVATQRYHKEAKVRAAVEVAMNKLQNKAP